MIRFQQVSSRATVSKPDRSFRKTPVRAPMHRVRDTGRSKASQHPSGPNPGNGTADSADSGRRRSLRSSATPGIAGSKRFQTRVPSSDSVRARRSKARRQDAVGVKHRRQGARVATGSGRPLVQDTSDVASRPWATTRRIDRSAPRTGAARAIGHEVAGVLPEITCGRGGPGQTWNHLHGYRRDTVHPCPVWYPRCRSARPLGRLTHLVPLVPSHSRNELRFLDQ